MATKYFIKTVQIFTLVGIMLLLSGCPDKNDKNYPVAEEEYLMGWVLHNIDDSTPNKLTYSYEDLAVYNYSYNYPANSSKVFDNVLLWIAPFQTSAGAYWVRMSVPQNRVYYLKGDKVPDNIYNYGWSLSNYMHINYLTSDDYGEQFGLDVAHQEHYKSENAFFAINPIPGVKEHIYFGTSPFTPTSIIIDKNAIKLNDHLLRGYGGKSYLRRQTVLTVWTPEGIKEIRLPVPKYMIYLNGGLIEENNLSSSDGLWDYRKLNYYLDKYGNYEIDVEISSGYPVFNEVKIKTSFFKDAKKENLEFPILKHIEFPSGFEIGKPMGIGIEFENDSAVSKVSMYYKTGNMGDWSLLGNFKNAELVITDGNAKEISFKFDAATTDVSSSYEIHPISLRKVKVLCEHELDIAESKTFVDGVCTDDMNNFVVGIRLEFYSEGKFLGAGMTDNLGKYKLDFDGNFNKIDVRFKGTGVYNAIAKEKLVCKIMDDICDGLELLTISNLVDGHSSLNSNFKYNLCCESNLNLNKDGGTLLFKLSDPAYDAHISVFDSSNFPNNVYLNVEKETEKASITTCTTSPCIASVDMIGSRDDIVGKAEPNAPNTVDKCTDGTAGSYLSDESVEMITIRDLDSQSNFNKNDLVEIKVATYCYDSNDILNLVYKNDANDWRVIDSQSCSGRGIERFTFTFNLDNEDGDHVIRAAFDYFGSPTATCASGVWADNDDVIIKVGNFGPLQCTVRSDCESEETCMLSISQPLDDAHIASCENGFNGYDKFCCKSAKDKNDTMPPIAMATYDGFSSYILTNEYSNCRYGIDDLSYSELPYSARCLDKNCRKHYVDLNLVYAYIRCGDSYGNKMKESILLNLSAFPSICSGLTNVTIELTNQHGCRKGRGVEGTGTFSIPISGLDSVTTEELVIVTDVGVRKQSYCGTFYCPFKVGCVDGKLVSPSSNIICSRDIVNTGNLIKTYDDINFRQSGWRNNKLYEIRQEEKLICGNNICEEGEKETCPEDCPLPPPPPRK